MKNSQAVQAAGAAAAAAAIAEKNAAAAAAAAAAVGRDYLKQVRFYLSKITGVFAQSAIATLVIMLFPFCFSAGLLAYTENNKSPTGGFDRTATQWREALTLLVIFACILSSYAIFLKHQTVLLLMGTLIKWCAIALFVVAGFDMESYKNFCVDSPQLCSTTTNANFDPRTVGNLAVAPYMDYACVVIFAFGGAVIRQRGELIVEGIAEAQRNVALINREAPEAQIDSVSLQVQ